ncbi:MAG TPA: hypothetical protein DDZ08_13050, partial [Cobetia sp.]|nr:hypothetical protein [Cobetia sp.]
MPNSLHRLSSSSCTQRTPAGLPLGMPGIGLEIEGAMQQPPQPARQPGAAASAEGAAVCVMRWRTCLRAREGRAARA